KGFSRVETPLFEGMLVEQEIEEEGDADEHVEEVTSGDDAHGDDTVAQGEVLTVNEVTRLQALVDKKKVVITEAVIREVLRLDDAKGVDCLPNEEIFTELARIGYEKPSTKLTFYKAVLSSQWKFLIHTILQCMSAKRTSWNEFSSLMTSAIICLSTAMLLKKLIEKLGDPGKFLIPCDFPGMDVCHTLVDLELADRSITRPGVAEDVFVKVGKFHFPTNFVVVDFEADPRVPLILGRSFFRTGRAIIDVYGEEITLRVNDEAVTFNLNQTPRYSSTYDDLSINRIDIIDVAREECAQEILGFSSNFSGGCPTSTFEPILSESSPSITPFEGSDFILEEIEAYLEDDSVSP
nr:reverse transcriptase domain-containing protein [Tanacetum cinerariifolium]